MEGLKDGQGLDLVLFAEKVELWDLVECEVQEV